MNRAHVLALQAIQDHRIGHALGPRRQQLDAIISSAWQWMLRQGVGPQA